MSPLIRAFFAAVLAAGLSPLGSVRAAGAGLDTARIEALTGLKGSFNEREGVFKVASPRRDVAIKVEGWTMPPFMGLTSWAAFKAGAKAPAMVMGDLVLFEDEVNPVLSALLAQGVEVTALHNHFFFDQPHVYFMHLGGEGTIDALAGGVKAAFATVARVRAAHPAPGSAFSAEGLPDQSTISAGPLEAALAAKAQRNSGMVKFVFGRQVTMECGCAAGADLGVNTWAAFAGADDNAVVDGDFAVKETELQAVLKSLRGDGINIVAIHSHMTGETPRMLFLHYWGRGPAADLAAALKRALSTQAP
ncbi:MAG TPA: DUF1259 domain-containing protein [Lacunisphaera sp.]|jgi:hypothetical protein|nr:DUF1259 domain-containing protein [Lacunisphaera sp.]